MPLLSPPLLRRLEYGALLLTLAAFAAWQPASLGGWFWFWLVAPDLFGLLPASFMGTAPARYTGTEGVLPPRGVWLYNAAHTAVLPLIAWIASFVIWGSLPWPLLGWFIHLAADRTAGYGLRAPDGTRTEP